MPLTDQELTKIQTELQEQISSFISCLYDPDSLPEGREEVNRMSFLMHRAHEDAEWSNFLPHERDRRIY